MVAIRSAAAGVGAHPIRTNSFPQKHGRPFLSGGRVYTRVHVGGQQSAGGGANTDTHARTPVPDATVRPEWTAMEGMPRYAELEIKALEALRRALLCECGFV